MNHIGLTIFAVGANAGGWNRRVYYDALGCKGNMVHGIMVWQSPNCAASSPLVNTPCEEKSTSNPLSSEGTSCETASQSSESFYFPPQDQAGRASMYVAINKYTSGTCSGISDGFEQSTFAADGKCYADESGSYFRATCDGQTGTVFTYCQDSSCNGCTSQVYDGTCTVIPNGLAVRGSCIDANSPMGKSDTISPNGAKQTTGPATDKPATDKQKNSVAAPDRTTVGVILAMLAGLLL
jgi:hypothetical protein